ncbi:MAG: flagellar biosynthesis protein FlhB [Alteromonadaceae bacterium]|nr:MAG: flagellar biosynthesis protein FlhB [Alteromonadaceae bacterium]
MADDSAQEKSEEPTQKRLDKAKEDGEAPRSREFTTTAVLLVGALCLYYFGGNIAMHLAGILRNNFTLDRRAIFDTEQMFYNLGQAFYDIFFPLVPVFALLAIAAFLGPLALGGWLFSVKSIAPKFNRLSPIAGLKRMFSVKSLVELVKSIAKVVLVMTVSYFLLASMKDELLGLAAENIRTAMTHSLLLAGKASLILAASTILIAMVDIPFQIFEHTKKLKMSLQDVKDEMKDTEGKPEVKGRIRQLQQEMSSKRMMSAVPEADVVITNPTHFSVALKYDPETMDTPILLAKGVDHTAMRIREIARLNNIEQLPAPVLARAIYHTTEVDHPVPEGLYVAVAQVLAYVFQLREFRRGQSERPDRPARFNVPPDMKY